MKSLKLILSTLIFLVLYSCNRNEEISVLELTDEQKISELKSFGIKGIPFPEGSKVMKVKNEEYLTKIVLPENVYFVVKNEKGKVFRVSELGVRCICSQGAGCSPVKARGEYYCVMDSGCSVCTSKSISMEDLEQNEELQIVGVMNEERSISVFSKEKGLFKTTQSTQQYGITEDFFKCEEVKKAINEVYLLMFPNEVPAFISENTKMPSDYTYVKVDFFGNNIFIPSPKNVIDESDESYSFEEIEGNENLCKCYSGNGCQKKSMLGAIFCDAGSCSDCQLK